MRTISEAMLKAYDTKIKARKYEIWECYKKYELERFVTFESYMIKDFLINRFYLLADRIAHKLWIESKAKGDNEVLHTAAVKVKLR